MSRPSNLGGSPPRWSTGGHGTASEQTACSCAGLPASSACVWVGPPLAASGPRRGSVPGWSVSSRSWQVLAFSTLPPRDAIRPKQLPPVGLLATIVFARKVNPSPIAAPPPLLMPPPDGAELLTTVLLRTIRRDETS